MRTGAISRFSLRFLPASWILTFRLLRRQNQNGDLGGVRLADAVRDRQLELVHPRRQIGNDDLVLKVCFLQSVGAKSHDYPTRIVFIPLIPLDPPHHLDDGVWVRGEHQPLEGRDLFVVFAPHAV